jgi:lipopolysaccharide transport protein LptA
MQGGVTLTSDDLVVKTATASYDGREEIVTMPDHVEFTRGRVSGSGVGATYDRRRDVISLLDAAHITVAPDAEGGEALEIDAGAAGFARSDKTVGFERTMRATRGTRVIEAETAVARLSADEQRLELLELRGNSSVSDTAASGGFDRMSARDIDLAYTPDGRALQRARLEENAVISMVPAAGQPPRRIGASAIDLGFAPDGTTVTSLDARGGVDVMLPAGADGVARRIAAGTLKATGDAAGGLRTAIFEPKVVFQETRAATASAPAVERQATANRLDATTAPGLGSIEAAHFRGAVQFVDGGVTAVAPDARYDVGRSRIALSAAEGVPGSGPQVADGRTTIEAGRIDLAVGSRRLSAESNVRSVFRAGAKESGRGGDETRLPGMLAHDKPVTVIAERLEYDGDASQATYSGKARLWQAETSIRAETMVLDSRRGNLTAKGTVESEFLLEHENAQTKARERALTVVTADALTYEDAARRAAYSGNAVLKGPQGEVTGETILLFLAEGGGSLDRAESSGPEVTVRVSGGFATGTALTYFAETEKYLMTGSPVTIYQPTRTGCDITRGASLTFVRSVDTIRVDATAGSRTETTQTSTPCPVRRP